MAQVAENNLDYLAACLHGRRGRVAEGERLKGLCRLRTISELSQAVFTDVELQTCAEVQGRTVEDLLSELSRARRYLDETGGELVAWMLARFQVENLKVLLRGFLDRTPLEVLQKHLVALPVEFALHARKRLAAQTLDRFIDDLPMGMPRQALRVALGSYPDQSRPFFFEAALDRGYFQELLARADRISEPDKKAVLLVIQQEVNIFQFLLAVRGRFGYGLLPELLLPLHIKGCGLTSNRFNAMLHAPNLRAAAGFAVGRVIDGLPPEPESKTTSGRLDAARLEAMAWQRFLRLANRAFRQSHMGLAAIIGYLAIRRVEVANLVILSEGIRAEITPDNLLAHLIPHQDREVAYV